MFVQPLLQWKIIKYFIFSLCIYSLRYPACNVHAPYYTANCSMPGSYFFTLSPEQHNLKKDY